MSVLDVNLARKNLMDVLGESSKSYFAHLKSWFCMKTTKEEFDRQARLFLKTDQVHLHNDFLLAIVTKCQSLCQPSTYVYHGVKHKPTVVSEVEKIRPTAVPQRKVNACEIKPITVTRQVQPKNKPLSVNFDNRFQPVNPVSLLPPSIARSIEKPQVRYCSQDLTLPDAGLVHGRMLVAAWDVGLDHGCEDKAIKLILAATKQFLRELIVAIVTNRKGYRIRENKVIYSIGQPTLNPWLHNSWSVHDSTSNSYGTEISQLAEPPHVPAIPQTIQNAERDSAFYLACTSEQVTSLQPISVLDVFQTLQVKKSVIPWHTVHAVNMERISQRLYHPN
ncbi:transcriptional adapter 1 [Daphnia magna]|uniref:Transcriptional adapter 1 n=2 Tax=Daphnia magna TaxID=35525 RepID=A0A164VVF7_9CRUS|nr:transcriptional adapter 1 [Daphnia magna]KAK4025290.1 hypothetical protein OUZ56_014365 [Daphnia magna]KZS12698.1 Transcriptional adapter 1 [Daphnia magna]